MAKSKKNKSGLHKHVSSVLDGVPIPQGVRNWRPPEKPGPGRLDDSPVVTKSNISSVFKGVSVAPGDDIGPAVPKHLQGAAADVCPPVKSDHRGTGRSNIVKKLDGLGESSVKAARTERPGSVDKVVHYQDPVAEAAARRLGQTMGDRFSAFWRCVGNAGRKILVVSTAVLAIVMVLVYRYSFNSTPQETKASTNVRPPVLEVAAAGNEINWQVPERLPVLMMDSKEEPEQKDTQNAEPEQSTEEAGTMDLRSILFSIPNPSAVIGTRIVHVGDKIDDVTVVDIARGHVEFEKAGRVWRQNVRNSGRSGL